MAFKDFKANGKGNMESLWQKHLQRSRHRLQTWLTYEAEFRKVPSKILPLAVQTKCYEKCERQG